MKNHIIPLALGALLLAPIAANAAYPDHTVRILVTTAPGGGADATARLIAGRLSEKWGQPVIVENKPGADGAIVYNEIAHAKPDGYELAWVLQAFTVLPAQHKLDYDPDKDFAPISLIVKSPDVLLVKGDFPATNMKDFIALVKSKPGAFNYGSSGVGSPQFLEMEKLKLALGLNMVHVGYQGGAGPAQASLLGGETQALFQPLSIVLGQLQSGKMRALAITGTSPAPLMPSIPTGMQAAGTHALDDGGVWYGLAAPGRTPADIVTKIHDDMKAVWQDPASKKMADTLGLEVVMSSPAEFAKMLRDDIPREAEVFKSFKPQSK